MTLFARAATFLNRSLTETAGVSIRYGRAGTFFTLTAWVGRTQDLSQTAGVVNQARLEVGERDYLIPATAFAATGFGEPKRGDRIVEAIHGVEVGYELRPSAGQPAWRWSDDSRMRVHVKRCSPPPPSTEHNGVDGGSP